MCESHNMLGKGFMKPSTMVATQALKLYVGNVRLNTNAAELIRGLEEHNVAETGIQGHPVNRKGAAYWTRTHADTVNEECNKRGMLY